MVLHLLILIFFSADYANASACCGGTSTTSAITSDNAYELGVSVSRSTLIGDVSSRGRAVFRSPENRDSTYRYRVSAATLLHDRWQAGGAFSFAQPEESRRGGARAEDLQLQLGYEFLPEWTYHPLKPKGFAFLTFRAPTGRSVFEISDPQKSLSTGRGFYALGGEILFTKNWNSFDALFSTNARYGFSRSFEDAVTFETFSFSPGWEASLSVGAGAHVLSDFRIGAIVSPRYQQAERIRYSSGDEQITSYQLVWDTSVSVAYAVSNAMTVTVAYNDQTLLGPSSNTDLSRAVTLTVQHQGSR